MAELLPEDPTVLATDKDGVIRIAGTRVTLDTLVHAYRNGDTPEQIVQDYSALEIADVYATIAYYLRHEPEVAAYLERRRAEARTVRAEFKKRFPVDGLKAKLESRLH
ncbi:MAG: DUF433 domain-containing protein [Acidobacteriota bacterium]